MICHNFWGLGYVPIQKVNFFSGLCQLPKTNIKKNYASVGSQTRYTRVTSKRCNHSKRRVDSPTASIDDYYSSCCTFYNSSCYIFYSSIIRTIFLRTYIISLMNENERWMSEFLNELFQDSSFGQYLPSCEKTAKLVI